MPAHSSRPIIDQALLADMEEDRNKFTTQSGENYKVPDDGRPHDIRILPGTFGKSGQKFYVGHAQHWVVADGQRSPRECPARITAGAPCPFCDGIQAWRDHEADLRSRIRSGGGSDQLALKRVGRIIANSVPRISYAMNIMSRDDVSPLVRPFSAPSTVFSIIETNFLNNGPDILDPYNGIDFTITRSKKGGRTSYNTIAKLQPSALWYTENGEIDEATINDLLERRLRLDIIRTPDYDELVECYNSMVAAVQAGDEDSDMRDESRDGRQQQQHRQPSRPQGPPSGSRPPAPAAARPAAPAAPAAPASRPSSTRPAAPTRVAAPPAAEPEPTTGSIVGGSDAEAAADDVPMTHAADTQPVQPPAPVATRPTSPARPTRPAAAHAARPAAPAAETGDPTASVSAAAPAPAGGKPSLMERLKRMQTEEDGGANPAN